MLGYASNELVCSKCCLTMSKRQIVHSCSKDQTLRRGEKPVEGRNAIIVQLGITTNIFSLSAKTIMALHTAVHMNRSSFVKNDKKFACLFLKVEQIIGCSPPNSDV